MAITRITTTATTTTTNPSSGRTTRDRTDNDDFIDHRTIQRQRTILELLEVNTINN